MRKRDVTRPTGLLFDEIDRPIVEAANWHVNNNGYAVGYLRYDGVRKHVLLSRVVAMAPNGFEVDHVNRNRLDNRRQNLRLVLHAVNGQNRGGRAQANSTSGVLGVHFDKSRQKWIAHAGVTMSDGTKQKLHKRFDTKDEAASARLEWCRRNMPGFVEGSPYRG